MPDDTCDRLMGILADGERHEANALALALRVPLAEVARALAMLQLTGEAKRVGFWWYRLAETEAQA